MAVLTNLTARQTNTKAVLDLMPRDEVEGEKKSRIMRRARTKGRRRTKSRIGRSLNQHTTAVMVIGRDGGWDGDFRRRYRDPRLSFSALTSFAQNDDESSINFLKLGVSLAVLAGCFYSQPGALLKVEVTWLRQLGNKE